MLSPAHRASAIVLAAILAVAPSAHAQYAEAQPGTRIRIEAPGVVAGKYVGTVLSREFGTVRLGSPNAAPLDVPIDRITSMEISRGESRWAGAWRGVGIGVPIGLAVGLLLSTTDVSDRTIEDAGRLDTLGRGELVLAGAVGGALWGGVIGALVPKEQWHRFDVAPRSGLNPRQRRFELGFALAY